MSVRDTAIWNQVSGLRSMNFTAPRRQGNRSFPVASSCLAESRATPVLDPAFGWIVPNKYTKLC